jgi:hypothetical protein
MDGFHYRSQEEMFGMISKLLDNDTLRRRMSANAREAMERRNWDAVFDSVFKGYEEAVELHSRRHHSLRERWSDLVRGSKGAPKKWV